MEFSGKMIGQLANWMPSIYCSSRIDGNPGTDPRIVRSSVTISAAGAVVDVLRGACEYDRGMPNVFLSCVPMGKCHADLLSLYLCSRC